MHFVCPTGTTKLISYWPSKLIHQSVFKPSCPLRPTQNWTLCVWGRVCT